MQSGGGAALPGMIFNQSKKVTYTDAVTGKERSVYAGRMECTMQVLLHLVLFLLLLQKEAAFCIGLLVCADLCLQVDRNSIILVIDRASIHPSYISRDCVFPAVLLHHSSQDPRNLSAQASCCGNEDVMMLCTEVD